MIQKLATLSQIYLGGLVLWGLFRGELDLVPVLVCGLFTALSGIQGVADEFRRWSFRRRIARLVQR